VNGRFSALLHVDEGRWRSRAQVEGMLPLFELGKDSGEDVYHGSHLFKKAFHKGFEVEMHTKQSRGVSLNFSMQKKCAC
jgi:hypothetical protein